MAGLTTHVLDLVLGRPAAGVRVVVARVERDGARILAEIRTNADGRCDAPLVAADALKVGVYELLFHVGDYFGRGAPGDPPPFLDVVPLRFGVADPTLHYHVPLLVTPWAYSTYRGS